MSTSALASVLVHGWPAALDEVTGPAALSGSAGGAHAAAESAARPRAAAASAELASATRGAGADTAGRAGSDSHAAPALPTRAASDENMELSDAESVAASSSDVGAALRAAALLLVTGEELQSETGLCVSHFAAELDAVAVGGMATVEALRAPAVAPSAEAARQRVNGVPAPLFVWARRRVFLDVLDWAAWRLSDAAGHDVTSDLGAVAGALSDAIAAGRSDAVAE